MQTQAQIHVLDMYVRLAPNCTLIFIRLHCPTFPFASVVPHFYFLVDSSCFSFLSMVVHQQIFSRHLFSFYFTHIPAVLPEGFSSIYATLSFYVEMIPTCVLAHISLKFLCNSDYYNIADIE